jgi:signal transduction histidine kinase
MLNSFYAKLSALFLLLIVGVGVILSLLGVRAAQRYADEVEQKLNRTLAEEMVPRFQPLLKDSVDYQSIEAQIQDMTGINRRIEIYLLDEDGRLKASFGTPKSKIERTAVAMGPIERFMEGDDLPILGDDPRDANGRKPFSVAHIDAMGKKDCYLYVILGSEQFASTARMLSDSYIVQTALRGLAIVLLATAGLGLFFFRRLTKRLRAMQEVVSDFESGKFDRRMEVRTRDEIGALAECFNRMADTLVDTMEELREADRMRRELVANVSHDLRSPLASIQGYLETIQIKNGDLDVEERQRYVETALKNAQRLNSLVSTLFELSKLETKQIEPDREPFPIAELVQDVVVQHQPQAQQHGVDLSAELPDRRVRVVADIGLVERVLSNLIENALHYTPEGGSVQVILDHAGSDVRLRVEDTGPGIPEDDLPHVFERFYRVEKSRDRDRGGAGLGLAIASTIVDLHDRRLQVESTVGEGTTFFFTLPVEDEPTPTPAAA